MLDDIADEIDLLAVVDRLAAQVEQLTADVRRLEARPTGRHNTGAAAARAAGATVARPAAASRLDDVCAEVAELRELAELAIGRRRRRSPVDLEAAQDRARVARLARKIGSGRGRVSVATWRAWHGGAQPRREHFETGDDWRAWRDSRAGREPAARRRRGR